MRRFPLALGLVALVGAWVAPTAGAERLDGADHGGRELTADMTGGAEAPAPGDPDGTGTAVLTVNAGRGQVCFELTVADIDPATAAHIHEAPAGEPGPVVVTLDAPTDGMSAGCVTANRSVIRSILQSPEDFYVNVHNADFPGGAVRGQLG